MSHQPNQLKGKSASLDDFKFEPNGLDLKFSKNLITVLDGYRIHRTYDLTFIDKAMNKGDLPPSFIRQWGTIRSVLHKLASIGPKVPGVESTLNRKQYMSFISMAFLTISVPILLITWVFQIEFLSPIAIPLSLVAVSLVMINFLVGGWYNRKVAWDIHNYIEANQSLVARERSILKGWVQILIDYIARLMRKTGADPEKELIKFFNDDYNRIEVKKVPSGLRKHYVVKIQV
ncbi:MAG: hypothetical protein AM325_014255 [Candidatus Thorarchaeota archaeon SMTZ1-45]|nr:MAG: hypothetical protein AM325_15600 [Candidatus Thorarchaeota archaeon SMTZ1-45]